MCSGSVQYISSDVHVCRQSLKLFVVEKSSTTRKAVYKGKSRVQICQSFTVKSCQVGKSSFIIDRRTISCRQWMYDCVYVVHCLRAELRILSCTAIHLCSVFREDSCANEILVPEIKVRCFVLLRALSLSLLIRPYFSDTS